MADMQVVEIARTLARGGQIIAFDEPTSSLTPAERDGLFDLIRNLKRGGRGIIYITHRMPEGYAITHPAPAPRAAPPLARLATSEVSPTILST
jgi:ABC-type sugar transport system ATPase subunit